MKSAGAGRRQLLVRSAQGIGALVAITGVLAALLHVDRIATAALNAAAERLNPYPATRLTVDRAELSWPGRLRLLSVSLAPDGSGRASGPSLSADSLDVAVRLAPLLLGRLEFVEASLVGARVAVTQHADSTWDLTGPFAGGAGGDPGNPLNVKSGPIRVDRARIEVTFAPDGVDAEVERLEVQELSLVVPALEVRGPVRSARVDSLYARFIPPVGGLDPVEVRGAAELGGDRLIVPGLVLTSGVSNVTVQGTLLLPGDSRPGAEEIEFRVVAEPLALRDISGFVRTVDPSVRVDLGATLRGSASQGDLSLRATLSNGGTIDVQGVVAPLFAVADSSTVEPPVHAYQVEGVIEALQLETLLGPQGPVRGTIDARATATLEGRDPARLTGEVAASFAGLRIGAEAIGPTSISGSVDDGAADIRVEGSVLGIGELSLSITGRPLGAEPSLTLLADFRQEATGGDGSLEALGLRGLALHLQTQVAGRLALAAVTTAQLRAVGGTYRDMDLTGGNVAATWEGTSGVFRVDQHVGDARFTASGTLVDTWSGLDSMRLNATLRVTRLAAAGFLLDSAVIRSRLSSGSLEADVEAWLPRFQGEGEPSRAAGHLAGSLRGRPFGTEPYVSIDDLRFEGLDLSVAAGVPTTLAGNLRGRLDGFDLRLAALQAQLTLDASTIDAVVVDSGVASFTLSAGRLGVAGDLSSSAGELSIRGHVLPFGEQLESVVDELRARRIDLSALSAVSAPTTDLNFDARLSATGRTWPDLRAQGTLALHASSVREGMITSGSLAFSATQGTATASGEILSAGGRVALTANADGPERPTTAAARVDLDLTDLAAFLALDVEVATTGVARLHWTVGEGLDFGAELGGRVAEATVDTLAVTGSLAGSVLQLDSLRLASDFARGDGSGSLALGAGAVVPAGAALTARFELFRESPSISLPLLGPTSVESGSGRIVLGGPVGARTLTAELDLGAWRAQRTSGQGASVRGAYGPEGVAFTLVAPTVGARDTLEVGVLARHRVDTGEGVLQQLDISTSTVVWSLAAPVAYSLGDEVTIHDLDLASARGRVRANGTFSRTADHDLTVTLEAADLSWVGRPLGRDDLMLMADGQLRLSGNLSRPLADGSLRMEIGLREAPPGVIDLHFALADQVTTLEVTAAGPVGNALVLTGTIPLPAASDTSLAREADAPVDLTLTADSFDLSWLRALLHSSLVAELEGAVTGALTLGGSLEAPVLEGDVALAGGVIRIPSATLRYEDLRLAASVEEGELRVDRLHAASGSGTMEADGRAELVGFRPGALALSARFDRFAAWSTASLTGVVTGEVTLGGTAQEPIVEGSVSLEGSTVNLDDMSTEGQGEVVQLTEEDYRMLEDYFGYSVDRGEDAQGDDPLERFGMRLSVGFDRDVWVTRFPAPRVSLECRGDLEVTKDPGGPLSIVGTVEVLPERSYFRQFGRRFAVDQGTLTLDGDPSLYNVSASARWEVPSRSDPDEAEVTVTLGVSGTAERLDLTLGSDPEMDESQIVSYLATGRAEGVTAEGGDGSGLGTAMAVGAVAGALEGFAADRVSLDVVEIANDPVRGTTLVAGRYVSPDLYLGFRQPVTFGETSDRERSSDQHSEVELEYRWYRWLTMNLQGSASELRLFFWSRHAY